MPIKTSIWASGVELASHEMSPGDISILTDRRRNRESVWVISCDQEDNGARVDFNLGVTRAMAETLHAEGNIVDLMAPEIADAKHYFVDYGDTKSSDVMLSDDLAGKLLVQHVPIEISQAALYLN